MTEGPPPPNQNPGSTTGVAVIVLHLTAHTKVKLSLIFKTSSLISTSS